MSRAKAWIAALCGLVVLAAVVAGCGSSSSSTSSGGASAAGGSSSKKPILIGAAVDETALMAPTDDPALYGAQLEAKKINAAGGVNGRKIEFAVANTQLKPDQTRADALNLVSKGANVLWVTCDVDFSTPSIQVGLSNKLLTIAPCIGTDQMGPKRFGSAGKLAFSYGNVAQDEGAADARIAIKQGWKTANVVYDKQIVYNQNVCQAFANKFQALGGKVVSTQTWTQGDHTIANVANRVNASKAAVNEVCTTAAPDVSTFLSDVRSAGNMTPQLSPWSLDGTYWMPKDPKVATNVWTDSYASIYGDDPNPAVKALIAQLTAEGHAPTTGGFVTGAAAVDGIVAAIKQSGGALEGTKLAAAMEAFKSLPTLSGSVTFSPSLHTVFGREYRVLKVTGGKGKFQYLIKAGGLAQL
ncbi:MAG: ABC transporter substrate-binding protein [Actinomycetota bacterium]|nr:ABC transporter substrate-binding protein [Actinomycetota bacterium]